MKVSTLPNCWKKLLQNKEIEVNSEGIEAEDIIGFCSVVVRLVLVLMMCDWLEEHDDLGYQVMTEYDVSFDTNPEEENSSEDKDEVPVKKV